MVPWSDFRPCARKGASGVANAKRTPTGVSRNRTVAATNARRALLLAAALAAAASADEVTKTYRDPTFHATVSNVLVVGVHSDSNVRGMFENSVVRALRAAGATGGDSSLARMGSAQEVTADTVTAAARRVGADAVLITRVVDVQTQNPDATTTFNDYFRAYVEYQDPLPVTTTHTVRVRSDLYVLESETRVWGVESTGFEKQNLLGVIDGISKAITAQLRTDGLVR
jgi:hypothetical protein